MTTEHINMSEKLWDLSNLVTGFAIAQSIATTFAIAKGDLRGSLKGSFAHRLAFVFTLFFTGFYVFAIYWCYRAAMPFEGNDESIWLKCTIGRVCGVLLFTLVTLGTLYGHLKSELAPPATS